MPIGVTDLGDVHDLDGRQLSCLNMSTLKRNTGERRDEQNRNLYFSALRTSTASVSIMKIQARL